MNNPKIFLGGTPTDIDVRNLMTRWPELSMRAGDKMSHAEIEDVIKISRKTQRYITITGRWRRIVEKMTNKIIGSDRGTGFKVLNESEKLSLGKQKTIESRRRSGRAMSVINMTDRRLLSEAEQAACDHLKLVNGNILACSQLRIGVDLPKI